MTKASISGFSRSRKQISIVINLIDDPNVNIFIHLISIMYMQHIMIFLWFSWRYLFCYTYTCTSNPHHFQSKLEWNSHSIYTFSISTYGWTVHSMIPAIAPEGVASCFTIAADHFFKIVRCWQLVCWYWKELSILLLPSQPLTRGWRTSPQFSYLALKRRTNRSAKKFTATADRRHLG